MRNTWHTLIRWVLGHFSLHPAAVTTGLVANFRPIAGGETNTAMKERVTELKAAGKALLDECVEIASSAKTQDVKAPDGTTIPATVIEQEHKDRYDALMKQFNEEVQPEIERIEQLVKAQEWGNAPAGGSVALDAAAIAELVKNGGAFQARERKSLGRLFTESEEYQAAKSAGIPHMAKAFEFKGSLPDPMMRKDVYGTLPGGTSPWENFGSIQTDPFVESPRRTQRIRDLFGVRNTNSPLLRYFRVLGYLMEGGATNAASTVGQRNAGNTGFQAKPHTNLKFEPKIASAARIAHYELAHRDALTDEPQLQGIIDSELLYGLQIVEDAQILYGAGTGDDLEGILNVTGVQGLVKGTTPSLSTDNIADALRRAMTLVTLAEFEATGVVMHPSDLENLELLRSDGDERFYLFAATIQQGGEPRVWRVPVVQTQAITAGTSLVGAFGLGAQLYDLEQANIRISDQHAELFVENGIAILAEERLMLATKRPEAFVEVTNLA